MTSEAIRAVKGMPDLLPSETSLWQRLEQAIDFLMVQYGYQEIRIPVLEKTSLFKRSIGEVTDIVEKEMFTFTDRDKHETQLSLRPEGTAGCVRACLEHGLLRNQMQQRLWYLGPMFRRENPQKGRYRQFYQLGVEAFGFNDVDIEVEHILMMARLWKVLGLEKEIQLEVNSLGSSECRKQYKESLVQYFKQHESVLDDDAKRRLSTNPLRILDSKTESMQDMLKSAPKLEDFLSSDAADHFKRLKTQLDALGIDYIVNAKLVRGLDYYCHTVYEWTTNALGSQGTVCAGGRYDGLIRQLGGEPSFGVGFAMGLDRVVLLMGQKDISSLERLDGVLIGVGDKAKANLQGVAEMLRDHCQQLKLQVSFAKGNLNKQFKKADKSGARLALVVGDDELENKSVTVKYLREDKPQVTVDINDFSEILGALDGSLSN